MKKIIAFAFLIVLFPTFSWAMARMPSFKDRTPTEVQPLRTTVSLQDCYRLALRQSETLAMKKEDVEISKAQSLVALGDAVGDIDFVSTEFIQDSNDTSDGSGQVGQTLTQHTRRERKFVFDQPIFQGFKAIAGLRGAGNLKKQRKDEWKRAEQLLFQDVVTAFYSVLGNQKDVEVLQDTLKLFENRIQELNARVNIGRSRPSEIVMVQARMKEIESDLINSQGRLNNALHQLEFLTGMEMDISLLVDDATVKLNFEQVESNTKAAETRPDVEASKQAEGVAQNAIIVAQSSLWPQLSLQSNVYEHREGFQSGIDWDVLLKMDVPLTTGGTNLGTVKQSWSEWKKAKYSTSLTRREAQLDIKDSYQNWITALRQYKSLQEAVELANENFKLEEEDYTHSLVNNLEVLDALETLNNTKRESNLAYFAMKQNYWKLKISMGDCCESF